MVSTPRCHRCSLSCLAQACLVLFECFELIDLILGQRFCILSFSTSGMPDDIEMNDRMPRSWRDSHGESANDVFCMVKASMACRSLSQSPLLVFPAAILEQTQKFLRDANSPTCPVLTYEIEDARCEELRLIKHALNEDFPHMHRAVAWYEKLIQDPRPVARFDDVPQLSFLRHAAAGRLNFNQGFQLGAQQPPPKPHELQVVFHRNLL